MCRHCKNNKGPYGTTKHPLKTACQEMEELSEALSNFGRVAFGLPVIEQPRENCRNCGANEFEKTRKGHECQYCKTIAA